MYVEFFGLENNPFRARASGSAVFVGPQQAKVLSGLKKALSESDAVATVTGPVGVGKTTSTARALDTISSPKTVARIGRMRLGREEILELLLHEFGAGSEATGTLQRFGAFKRLLNDREDENVRVFIVVEDATRIGVEGLAELESLTSADSGETSGANIILMGPPDLKELLKAPQLARLSQRIRLRHSIEPFTQAEIRGYVAHRIRAAGGNFESMFAAGAIDAIHRCSEGIPRVANSICAAALTAAADAKSPTVSAELIERVAREEFGVEPARALPADIPSPSAPDEVQAEPEPQASAPEAVPSTPAEIPVAKTADSGDGFDVPDLIQDTLPAFEALRQPKTKSGHDIAEPADSAENVQAPSPAIDVRDEAAAAKPHVSNDVNPEALTADERRVMLEPRAPEPLSKTSDPADTQTIKALDSALRPDTQLLAALGEPIPAVEDDAPVPIGLQTPGSQVPAGRTSAPEKDTRQPPAAGEPQSGTGTERLPTLSESMRLAPPPISAPNPASPAKADTHAEAGKKPDIDALETALAVARKGPIDLNSNTDAPTAAPAATQSPATPAPEHTPSPATEQREIPAADSVPEITLEDTMRRQREAAQARLADEAARVAAAAKAEAEEEPSEAELAAAAELASEKERLAGMSSIGEQFSVADELSLDDLGATAEPAPAAEENAEQADDDLENREKLEKLAAELGSAKSLEDIDDLAAETLFGEEFSQMAATVAAMAANDMLSEVEAETERESNGAAPAVASIEEPTPGLTLAAPQSAPAAPDPVQQAAAQPAMSNPAAAAAPATPPPGTLRKPMPARADIDAAAARRLEMVRSLNQNRRPVVNAPVAEEIVLGNTDQGPSSDGPKPEPIENQFGTSMTANLKALSAQSVEAMQKEEEEEKKGGLLSRFKRP